MAKRTENKKRMVATQWANGLHGSWPCSLQAVVRKWPREIYHSYPATQADDIQVFKTGTNRPYSAELLGKVAVKETDIPHISVMTRS